MFVFILANIPLPIILYLNWRIITKYSHIHRQAQYSAIKKPRRLIVGWWLNNFAGIFVLIPVLTEGRIFVQNSYWLISFAAASVLSITGLTLMNSALSEELRSLKRTRT